MAEARAEVAMPGQDKTAQPSAPRPYGAMRPLSPDQRRAWQRTVLNTPPRRHGWDARMQFWLEDQVFGKA